MGKLAQGNYISMGDLFARIPLDSIDISSKILAQYDSRKNKRYFIESLFLQMFRLLMQDLSEVGISFITPMSYANYGEIYMNYVGEERFIQARKNGKLQNIDFLASNFSTQIPVFSIRHRNGSHIEFAIHLGKSMRNKIIEKINAGFKFKTTKKTIKDYIPKMIEKYPEISEDTFRTIAVCGFSYIIRALQIGCALRIQQQDLAIIIGDIKAKNDPTWPSYYINTLCCKLHYLYQVKLKYDGYYFTLSNEEYQQYLNGQTTFQNKKLYKIFDECNIKNLKNSIFMKVNMKEQRSFVIKLDTLTIDDNVSLYLQRDPMNFQDILLSNYEYKLLNQYRNGFKKDK